MSKPSDNWLAPLQKQDIFGRVIECVAVGNGEEFMFVPTLA